MDFSSAGTPWTEYQAAQNPPSNDLNAYELVAPSIMLVAAVLLSLIVLVPIGRIIAQSIRRNARFIFAGTIVVALLSILALHVASKRYAITESNRVFMKLDRWTGKTYRLYDDKWQPIPNE